ncbi:glycine rich protein [Mycobacteroides abscessus subsp. abscessus]|uniref:hypothetical protein n=1 Tax=Mycobacteroides abscessus TaxID=36809 RepID=UPI00092B20CE|nr:hypothetical protein [Mycobacteroides abscessus]SIE45486.1 glycine rich protein [Mycobacteroides abscessus subsp. abscessus]SKQ04189.1 glycine rich protein [Mycobacteroides abscessus subsp. massiliense]SKV19117.1 glycine rich protein [Mycobacteroides abscessus subsp. abscessus]
MSAYDKVTAALAAVAALGAMLLASPDASADPLFDPRYPVPALGWCAGGGSGSGYGGYCEGASFPDGARLNYFRVLGFWQGPRCIIPDGTPNPPAAPGHCGGVG